jgi:hypothetical protein
MSGTGFRKEMIQEPREFLTSNLVKDYLPSREKTTIKMSTSAVVK